MVVTEENAADYATAIYERYKARMVKTLDGIARTFREQGWEIEGPFDMSADSYEWHVLVAPKGHDLRKSPNSISIAFRVCEAMEHDGVPGVSFDIDVTGMYGYIVGGLKPYNYTPEVWVDMADPEAVEERFSIVENVSVTDLFNLCLTWEPPAQK